MSLTTDQVDFEESSIIYVTDTTATEWTIDATKELLKLYDEKIVLLQTGQIKNKRTLYEHISSEMIQRGHFYNGVQCENKWKSLKRSYLTRLLKDPSKLKTKPRFFENEVAEILKREKYIIRKSRILNPKSLFELSRDKKGEYTLPLLKREVQSDNEDDDDELRNTLEDEDVSVTEQYKDAQTSRKRFATKDSSEDIIELKHIVQQSTETMQELMRDTVDVQKTISEYFAHAEERAEKKLKLKKLQIEKQNEIVQQMKIQNSLIAKLIQKIGN